MVFLVVWRLAPQIGKLIFTPRGEQQDMVPGIKFSDESLLSSNEARSPP